MGRYQERRDFWGCYDKYVQGKGGFFLGHIAEAGLYGEETGKYVDQDSIADRRLIGPVLHCLRRMGVEKVKSGVVFLTGAP